jgi:hypothetical protein
MLWCVLARLRLSGTKACFKLLCVLARFGLGGAQACMLSAVNLATARLRRDDFGLDIRPCTRTACCLWKRVSRHGLAQTLSIPP